MTYSGQEYNIAVNLYSDNIKVLEESAKNLMVSSKHELRAVREAVFELHSPYPYSEMGKALSENNVYRLPDIMLVSVDVEEYQNICRKNKINLNGLDGAQGIFINTEHIWTQNGIVCHGKLFELAKGDTITMYRTSGGEGQEDGIKISIENYEKSIQQEKASVTGFEFLCAALIFLLVLVCICGNVTVSWTVSNARQKEFATLLSIGMKPGELRKMKYWELLFNIIYSFVAGFPAGLICHWFIFKIYSAEYQMVWHFPVDGLLLGTFVLGISITITEAVLKIYAGRVTMADMLQKV